MPTSLPSLLFTSALSAYGLILSYQNITRLQTYEAQSEKAAEWSNKAAQRLQKTRATQATGTISLLLSLLTSTALVVLRPSPSSEPSSSSSSLFLPLALSTVLLAARTYMARFWNNREQLRVPFVTKYNDAARGSEKVVGVLSVLAFSWGWEVVMWGVGGRGSEAPWVQDVLVGGLGWVGKGVLAFWAASNM